MQILYVEDHALFAKTVTTHILTAHTVKVVASLSDARRELSSQDFDVVLVDYDLDDGKGAELVIELRQRGYGGKIVGVSAHELGNQRLAEAGSDASCSKELFQGLPALLDRILGPPAREGPAGPEGFAQ